MKRTKGIVAIGHFQKRCMDNLTLRCNRESLKMISHNHTSDMLIYSAFLQMCSGSLGKIFFQFYLISYIHIEKKIISPFHKHTPTISFDESIY